MLETFFINRNFKWAQNFYPTDKGKPVLYFSQRYLSIDTKYADVLLGFENGLESLEVLK